MGDEDVVRGFGGLIGWPTSFVVGPDWQIHKKYVGQIAGKKESIEDDILKLLGAPSD